MNPNSVRPRRLHVSALAAVANPSYTRLDTWNLLDDACRHLAEVDLAGLDTTHDVARAKRLMDRIGAYERYWLYPGAQNLATFRAHLDSHSTVRLTEEVSLAVRLLSEYGDRTALFDTSASLAEQELVAQAKQQQFYTVLLADDSPATAPDSGRVPAAVAQSGRRGAVRVARGGQHRRCHHRGGAEWRDSGGDHPSRPAAAVPRPGAADDHAAGHRWRRSGGKRDPRLGGMRRVDP